MSRRSRATPRPRSPLELEDPEAPFLLVLTPAVQLLATILIERRDR